MIWAIKNNERIVATPKQKAICPVCNQEVISKCGEIKIWHWAHKLNLECDSFGEPESKWHLNWKNNFPKEQQEVVIGKHRADIRNKDKLIIELQNSPLATPEIIEREKYYKKMIWILNGDTIAKNLKLIGKWELITFHWKWFPHSWFLAKKPLFIDLSFFDKDILFKIEEINSEGFGCGRRISKTTFIIENGGKTWK